MARKKTNNVPLRGSSRIERTGREMERGFCSIAHSKEDVKNMAEFYVLSTKKQ